MGLRSGRRLCREVRLTHACPRFRRLAPVDKVPDRSSFSRLRHGAFRESGAPRRSVGAVAAGLACGNGFAVHAELIRRRAGRCGAMSREAMRTS